MVRRIVVLALAALAVTAAAAQADWNGDGHADVLAVNGDGQLLLYRTDGAGNFNAAQQVIGTGWGSFTAILSPGDWSGDGHPDLLARRSNGDLFLYRGTGTGGFSAPYPQIGSGWGQFTMLLTPGDWDGDGRNDLIARKSDGTLLLYRGDGHGGFVGEARKRVGSGWGQFDALLTPGDWDGDGHPDVIGRRPDGTLLLYRSDGRGNFLSEARPQIGAGWQQFTALTASGDFDGDQHPDVLARRGDGTLLLYRSDGAGHFIGEPRKQVGSGWQSLKNLMQVGNDAPAPAPPPPVTPPPPAHSGGGSASLSAGLDCTPPGKRVRVVLKIHRKRGKARPRVTKVTFFIKGGAKRTDRKAPYLRRLPVKKRAGTKFRVYARVSFKRKGSKKVRTTTVWRRYAVCA